MSKTPEIDLDLDLHFLPAWAQESATVNRYARYSGDTEDRAGRGDFRPPRRDGPRRPDRPPPRRDGPPFGGPRPGGGPGGPGGPRREGGRGDGGFRGPRPGGPRDRDPREVRPPVALPDVRIELLPDEAGVDSLARQIKLTGRAYPIFDVAHLILKKAERYQIVFETVKKPTGEAAQGLWVCNLDESVWLSEADAVRHVLGKHFDTFYQTEKIATEAPKGVYTFVAQCGMSGAVLGPPNYHDYQTKLHKLHTDRFSRMPFDVFKSRVKIVRDEAVVKQWVEEQSWKLEYQCLNVPEPKKLVNREEVERHFREVHLANIIRPVDRFVVSSPQAREHLPGPLQALARRALEDQQRFPIQVVHILSHQFSKRGLQFFKVNKSVTHVAIARPHFLDVEATPVSDGVRRIVDFINAHPKSNRKKLVEALVPAPEVPAVSASASPETAPTTALSPLQDAVISDLHWLVHQGHVIEFATGELDTAKKPLPKPPRPEPPAKIPPAPTPAAPAPVAEVAPEVAPNVLPAAVPTEAPGAIIETPAGEQNPGSAS